MSSEKPLYLIHIPPITFRRILDLSGPSELISKMGYNNHTYLTELLWWFSRIIFVKIVELCVVHRMHYVNGLLNK